MLGHASSFHLALQEIIPAFISYTFSERQIVGGKLADHFFHQPCDLVRGLEIT